MQELPILVGATVGGLTILGAAGRGARKVWVLLKFISQMIEVVHARSAELAPNHGASMRDRIKAIDEWRPGVDSSITSLDDRVGRLEQNSQAPRT